MYITNIVFQVLDFMCSFLKDGVIEYGVALYAVPTDSELSAAAWTIWRTPE